ncbi:MAG: hypothetical protein ACOC5T_04535 [Elusimicrobiota bacterium]
MNRPNKIINRIEEITLDRLYSIAYKKHNFFRNSFVNSGYLLVIKLYWFVQKLKGGINERTDIY